MKNSEGKIISINKDLYSVLKGTEVFLCTVRGKLKNIKLTVGDNVLFNEENKTIESVQDRKNTLIRPLISNKDKLFIVVSSKTPDFSTYLLDKFLVLSENNNIEPIIVITKLDIIPKEEKKSIMSTLKYYKKIGYKVYKNTMMKRAFAGTALESLTKDLDGTNAIAISKDDATAPARIIAKFAKTAPKLEMVSGVVEGNYYDKAGMEALANVPSREELLGKLLGSIQSPIANLARVLNQIAESKGGAAEA